MCLILNDEVGHTHTPGAEQGLNTLTETGTVEGRLVRILGSVFWVFQIKCWNCVEISVFLEVW